MKRLTVVLISGVLATAPLRCRANPPCAELAVGASVESGSGELTLADLLAPSTCAPLRNAAARVSLGASPRPGKLRVLDGSEIRRRLEDLSGGMSGGKKTGAMTVPERVVVKRKGAMKSCREIARFVAEAAPAEELANVPSRWGEVLDCAAARSIPQEAPLELAKSRWNGALERWEFAVRCARSEDCVPFMVWVRDPRTALAGRAWSQSGTAGRLMNSDELLTRLQSGTAGAGRLVTPGQTATLTWDQGGIRVVLPVTCLDAGELGQLVRVRLNNAARILRAEVVGEGTLRASL